MNLNKCLICNKETKNKKYCSSLCYGKSKKGKIYEEILGIKKSEETKRKIGERQKGRHHTEETKKKMSELKMGNKNPNYGRDFSEEYRKKIGKTSLGRYPSKETREKIAETKKGEKNPNYGKSPSKETKSKFVESYYYHQKLILERGEELKGDGFKVFYPDIIRPDIIAVKNNKIYAVEIECDNHIPDTQKYNKADNFFDDIWWFIMRKEKLEEKMNGKL